MEQRPEDNQFTYDPLLSFDSFSFTNDVQLPQQQQASSYPEPATIHLQQPTYSQHHASLDGAVESSRWEAYGRFDAAGDSYGSAFGSPVGGALQSAISQGGTIGDVLNHLPPVSLQQSPPTGQYRRLSFDEEGTEGSPHTVKPFIAKLLELLDNPSEYCDCLVWDDAGRGVIICNSPRLTQEILPRFFGHSNIHSFTRQLNVYGFSRMSQAELADTVATNDTSQFSGWRHAFFLRDDRSMLTSLTPKPSKARMQKKMEKQERLQGEEQARRQTNLGRRRASGSGSGGNSGASLSLSPSTGGSWPYPAP
ncbi:HSF-type DNA-binding-domain-containing protein [Leucosporidium creatinivorum]|uniref:HSF-type DNA-binding-domain-containing protein n=1 Tax=Leucosporidium creatinivorum TaxID=106004 RepID=A0A1Y2EQE8_9BASI|nr:HSF-type DNA-binding-domain-containing protein [Leucosporidium creatinivorum]